MKYPEVRASHCLNKKSCYRQSRLRLFKLLLLLLSLLLIILTVLLSDRLIFQLRQLPPNHVIYKKSKPKEAYVIDTPGCRILDLKPFDDFVAKLIYPEVIEPTCDSPEDALLRNNATHIWVETKNMQLYSSIALNTSQSHNFSCLYFNFYRPNEIFDINSMLMNHRRLYREHIVFTSIIAVGEGDEFVKVRCYSGKEPVYAKYFLFTPKKKFLSYNGVSEINKSETKTYNVLVIGIDNMSRLNLHRTMDMTLDYLKQELGAVEFYGYNKIGDNTYVNVIPLLTGLDRKSLEDACIPHNTSTLDNCPFIWDKFKEAGFYTAFGEDMPSNYGPLDAPAGFANTPTDYYTHTFMVDAFASTIRKTVMKYGPWCVQDRYSIEILLDYIAGVTSALFDKRLFGYFWEVSFSHFNYSLNYPLYLDQVYKTLFTKLYSSGYLNETIILFLSDHGMRTGEILFTTRGRLETRLPFLYVMVPRSFREHYSEAYENLKVNSRRLTTPFDVYETLKDLLDLGNLESKTIHSATRTGYMKRGISLFMPIPDNRTCEMAGIDDQWCSCFDEEQLSVYSATASETSMTVVQFLNVLLMNKPACAPLKLDEILDVEGLVPAFAQEDQWRVRVIVRTKPGSGVFEATLVRETGPRFDDESAVQWRLTGQVNRLNSYGHQSQCVLDRILKLYCYCLP